MLTELTVSRSGIVKALLSLSIALLLSACGGGGGGSSTSTVSTGPGTLQFSAATYSGNEDGGPITVTVTRTGGSTGAVTIDLADALSGSATSGTDFSNFGKGNIVTLSWADGESTAKTIDITPVADGSVEPDETVDLNLSNITGGATLGTTSIATVTILNDDTAGAPGTLQFSAGNYTAAENGKSGVTITVVRVGGDTGAVSVDYADAGTGTATSGSDYTAVTPATLNWADGDGAPKTFLVSVINDTAVEPDETVDLALSGITGGATLGTAAASLTITSEDAYGTLQFNPATYTESETGGLTATITVSRTGGSSGAVSVDYADALTGSATSGSDYNAIAGGTLSWADGDTADKSFNVTIINDTEVENDETVNLTLSNEQGGATLGTASSATLTIQSEDTYGTLQFNPTSYTATEAGGTVVTITATRTGGSGGAVSVDYADAGGGTATPGSDYNAIAGGTLSWASGDSTPKTFNVTLIDDAAIEPDETVNLALSNVQGGATLGASAATLTITSDDNSVQFNPTSYTAAENGTGTATITVTRLGTHGAVSVDFADAGGGSATSGSDYNAITGGTLNWADGDTTPQTFNVTIINDTLVENDETVNLGLSNPTGGAVLGNTSATLTITSDDAYGTLKFNPATYSINENDPGGTATITVSRINGSSGAVSVDYADALTGTASSGVDYSAITAGTLSWADGDTADKTFTVTIIDDVLVEGNETVDLTLSNVQGNGTLGTSAATLTIVDDEAPPVGDLQLTASSYAFDEFAGTVTIYVTRTGGSAGAVTVDYATSDNTAVAGSDYTTTSGTLSWADGDTADKPITLTIIDDTVVETDEDFAVTLSNPTGGAALGAVSSALVTINWDDTNLTMNIGDGTYWVAFQDGLSGTWTQWSPSTGNTYDFPVTDASGRYGVALHHTESAGGATAEKVYVIHATVAELPSFNAFEVAKWTVSGTLSNYTGSNDTGGVIMNFGGVEGTADPYAYSLPTNLVAEGLRDFFSYEQDSVAATPPEKIVIRRDQNITADTTINVDFTNDPDVELLDLSTNHTFSTGCTVCFLNVYFGSANGTAIDVAGDMATVSGTLGYPYIGNTGFKQPGDTYSFRIITQNFAKIMIRNFDATVDPGNKNMGPGNLDPMTGANVTTSQTTGLSYTPNALAFSGSPVFRGFEISLDQTNYAGPHWQIMISKGWADATGTTYTHPNLAGVTGFDTANWDLLTGTNVDPVVTAITTPSGVSIKAVFAKTMGSSSNSMGVDNWVIWKKLAIKPIKVDIANQFITPFTW